MPDRKELTKALQKYYDELYNFSLYTTGNYRTADRLTLRIIKEALDFSEFYVSPDLHKWLLRIALNLYYKYYYINPPDALLKKETVFSTLSPYVDNKHLQELFTNLSENKILKLFTELPSSLRLPIVLKDIQDMDYKTISEFLDLPEKTVVLRLAYARKIIYTKLIQ